MKIFTSISLIMMLGVISCSAQTESKPVKKPKTMKTASGLEYTITHKGNGKKPNNGDMVVVHYTGKLTNDTVFDSSVRRNQPFSFKLGVGQVIKGWDEGIALLEVGDKAVLRIPSELGYGERGAGANIPPNSTLIFEVELLDIKEGPKPFDVKGRDTLSTESGLKIIKLNENPSSEHAQNGKMVSVHYTGYLLDGKVFDSSVERGSPFSFELGAGQVIKGWDEGIATLRVGEKARLIIPYQLAYGDRGVGPIPAKSDLIFDVELMGIQSK